MCAKKISKKGSAFVSENAVFLFRGLFVLILRHLVQKIFELSAMKGIGWEG